MLPLPFARVLHCWEVRKGGEYTSVLKYINTELAVGSVTPAWARAVVLGGCTHPPRNKQLQELLGMEKPRQPNLVPQWAASEPGGKIGFMTPEGLRLMGKSCPARPLGPSLPTQALLGCPEQQAPALLPVVFLLWGIEKSFLMVLKGYRLVLLNITMKLPSSLLKTSPEPSLRDNCLPH